VKEVIGVVGQGYVGLPLALEISRNGFSVIGVDTNQSLVDALNSGHSSIEDISGEDILKELEANRYKASTDYSHIKSCQIILVCVPTPLNGKTPDLKFLIHAVSNIGYHLDKGDLVIVESTVEPETTREILLPILEKNSKLNRKDFYVAFSPERIDPTNQKWGIKNTPKLVAGFNQESKLKAMEFYSKFVDSVVGCESLEVAESAKLLENSFRLINISFINEFSIFCQKLGIELNDVIKAASTKPYGFMPFYPSIGVGGHCIPVDPLYLANKAREIGAPTRFIDLADQINQEMPGYFVGRAEEKIGGLKSKKVLVIGVSYKPNVADVRETPVEALILGLKNKGAEVFWHDDLVKEWNGEKSVALSDKYDLAILATPHAYLDPTKLGDMPILNTRGSI